MKLSLLKYLSVSRASIFCRLTANSPFSLSSAFELLGPIWIKNNDYPFKKKITQKKDSDYILAAFAASD